MIDLLKKLPDLPAEPRLAIFGGPDGLDLYRRLFSQVENLKHKPLYILCEALPPQHELLASIAQSAGYNLQQTDDFIQVFQRGA
jgi:methylase of polypeptide subunit release factors